MSFESTLPFTSNRLYPATSPGTLALRNTRISREVRYVLELSNFITIITFPDEDGKQQTSRRYIPLSRHPIERRC